MKKLNQKLTAILQCIPAGYNDIWDCCCDHGYLGMSILQKQLCETVHFVDQVPGITAALEEKLIRYQAENYQVHTLSAANIELKTSHKHCVILAGISGNTVINIMEGILHRHPNTHILFILSPQYHSESVHRFLRSNALSLSYQGLLSENNQQYEILITSTTTQQAA